MRGDGRAIRIRLPGPLTPPVFHIAYIFGSVLAAALACLGIWIESPVLYGIVPGIIGGTMALVAAVRFFRSKVDLAGFISTFCGFVYYQAYQANPVMLPEFTGYMFEIPKQDQMVGIGLANLTTAMLLVSCLVMARLMGGVIRSFVPDPGAVTQEKTDNGASLAFWTLFAVVALPNVLFGKVVVGAYRNIVYQRLSWSGDADYSGFETWGGPLGGSVANMALWATSLFFIWLYLLRSRHRFLMLLVSPLVLLWTASVALQGSRTYLVTIAVGIGVFVLGDAKLSAKAAFHAIWAIALLFILVQVASIYRGVGLQAVNLPDFASHALEVSGNEGASSEMDGVEYFRTELLARGTVPNPAVGFVRGMLERPVEGLMMPIPRSLFPLKPVDESGTEYNLFFENVRLGVETSEVFLGASPGLIGRELIKYGFLGPITLFFWMGLALALANQLYESGASSDFHRIFAAVILAFFVAQARDFSPVWFIPFLPAFVILAFMARRAKTAGDIGAAARVARSVHGGALSASPQRRSR
jgi:hypothetical protein